MYSGTCIAVCGANKPLARQIWADLDGSNDILEQGRNILALRNKAGRTVSE